MEQIKLAKLLKAVVLGCGVCGAVIYLYLFPFWGNKIVKASPELSFCFWPWLVFLWITAVPCYIILVCGYKISSEIANDNSFSIKNAKLLKNITVLAAADSAFFFLVNILFLLFNMSHPAIVLISVVVSFAGCALTVAAGCLSHLVFKAAKLQEENELTI